MNLKLILLCAFFLFSCLFSHGRKKEKWIIVHGQVVDTLGQHVALEKIALINRKGYDARIVTTDDDGTFILKVKRKNRKKFYVKCYSAYGLSKTLSFADFAGGDQRILVYTNYSAKPLTWDIRCYVYDFKREALINVPFNPETNEFIRSYFPGVK